MTLARHVQTLGRGPGRSRSLTRAEAAEAMALMLQPGTAPEAIGALLMLLRMKGETPAEIAGLAEAAQAAGPAPVRADLDWPSYAAGRTRGMPWFLLSARLVARAGWRVVLHGRNASDDALRTHLPGLDIPVARTARDADVALDRAGIVYLPLESTHPALFNLLDLRATLGLRSCVNTVCRMLNPARAPASVQGVFHPSYRLVQADAAHALGWKALSVIKGGGGEFERHPGKAVTGFGLRKGQPWEAQLDPLIDDTRRLSEATPGVDPVRLWSGQAHCPFAEAIIIGTAALALDTLGVPDPQSSATRLWQTRSHRQETAA